MAVEQSAAARVVQARSNLQYLGIEEEQKKVWDACCSSPGTLVDIVNRYEGKQQVDGCGSH